MKRAGPGGTFDLTGRIALVTGGSRGIGRAIAEGLAAFGADVILHYRSAEASAIAAADAIRAQGRRCELLQADLTRAGSGRALAESAIAAGGRLDIVILNAATSRRQPFAEIAPADIDAQVNSNFTANLEILQACLPGMAARGWGRAVTIGSVQQVRPNPALVVYAAMKSAQLNLVRNLARLWAKDGVTINNLAPGLIETDATAGQIGNPETLDQLLSEIPARSVGRAEDCVGPVLLLCSEAGRYITGADLFVDGGMHLHGRVQFIGADGAIGRP